MISLYFNFLFLKFISHFAILRILTFFKNMFPLTHLGSDFSLEIENQAQSIFNFFHYFDERPLSDNTFFQNFYPRPLSDLTFFHNFEQ